MKREHLGWLLAGCLLLALAVVLTLLFARGRTEAPKSSVSGQLMDTGTRESSIPADGRHGKLPTQDVGREVDSIQHEIDAVYAKMGELAAANPPPPTSTIDGTSGEGEEAGVMPDYYLGNATEHVQKAKAATTDEAKSEEIRAARKDLASAKRYLASAEKTISHVPAARIETVPERVATFDPGPTIEVDPVFPRGVYANPESNQCTVYGLVDTNGMVIAVKVTETTGVPALDDAVVKSAYASRLQPGRYNGVLARVWVRISYRVPSR